jgi:hypothetical protein
MARPRRKQFFAMGALKMDYSDGRDLRIDFVYEGVF